MLLIGATGATGREVIRLGLERGLDIRALVRDRKDEQVPGASLPAAVRITRGDIRDDAAVTDALSGETAVISLLGARRGDPVGTVRSAGTASLVQAMEAQGARRLVSVSSVGIGSSVGSMSTASRLVWPRIVGAARLAEAERAERAVMASSLDWTIVRPPRLVDGPATGRIDVGERVATGMRSQLARVDLASLLLDLALGDRFVGAAVTAVGAQRGPS
jgi:putative NADH-flavin reductase